MWCESIESVWIIWAFEGLIVFVVIFVGMWWGIIYVNIIL